MSAGCGYHDSSFTAKDSEMTKEMEMSANFQGGFYREETTSAGWGQLERSFKSEQEDMLDDGADSVPVPLKYRVKGQHVTPPPLSINYAGASQSSSDQYDSPIKCEEGREGKCSLCMMSVLNCSTFPYVHVNS